MSSKPFKLSEEQIALSEKRRLQKIQQRAEKPEKLVDLEKGQIVSRPWIQILEPPPNAHVVKVLTFNLLAQCLVRRDLFPTSDCLKAPQREHMIFNEITSPAADILCLQEVDRLEKLLPVLEQAGFSHIFAAGPRKKHGCLIAFRKDKYSLSQQHYICYDDEKVRKGVAGSSFRTKNIGSMVALKSLNSPDADVIIATTHLFWHPRYNYERARQAAILVREVVRFRDQVNPDWPCILAGDFNFAPNDPAYSLLAGDPILPAQEELLRLSRVVHKSIEPDREPSEAVKEPADEEDAEKDPDKIITNARMATPDDGLLSTTELVDMMAPLGSLKSSYERGQKLYKSSHPIPTFGDRVPTNHDRHGGFEPEWTSYTHYWKTVLDYIFVLDPPTKQSTVIGFLQPLTAQDLEPGLPQKLVCGSDHVSLVAEISW